MFVFGWGSVALLKDHWPTLTVPQFSSRVDIPPLAMEGGDPYLRALMRTISASESNTPQPYHVIYGGQHVKDLSQHPDVCITIKVGPNRGNCSTASGRYQFLNTTWAEKATKYHPHPQKFLFWKNYSFEPQYQDQVLYRWLSDSQAWGVNLSDKLKTGAIDEVLKRLSPTWTSLGYGIETNWMSHRLPQLYKQLLQEELELVSTPGSLPNKRQ
jgi:muramidase (phage lysozyme)